MVIVQYNIGHLVDGVVMGVVGKNGYYGVVGGAAGYYRIVGGAAAYCVDLDVGYGCVVVGGDGVVDALIVVVVQMVNDIVVGVVVGGVVVGVVVGVMVVVIWSILVCCWWWWCSRLVFALPKPSHCH